MPNSRTSMSPDPSLSKSTKVARSSLRCCWLRVRRFFVFSRPDVVEALISSFGPKQETETGKQPFCPSSSCNLSPIFLARTACERTMDSARSVCSADSAFISTMVSAMSCLFLSCSILVTMTTSGSSLVGAITMIISKGTALRKMRTSMSCGVALRGIHWTQRQNKMAVEKSSVRTAKT
eukprot:scaffold89931_cov57-Phaeocystis_antarctica.AAC.2